jgi:putative adhesin
MLSDMKSRGRIGAVVLAALVAVPSGIAANRSATPEKDHVLTARHLNQHASIKVFSAAGAVRLIAWPHDSLEVRGTITPARRYYAGGNANGFKFGVEEPPGSKPARGDLTVFLPAGTEVSVKTADGDIDATDVSGWFYTIGGHVHISGTATSIDIEAMRGDVEVRATVPWLRARSGEGRMTIRGALQDVDASTVSGALDVESAAILRGQFASVSGDIHYAGAPAARAILDFSDHSGAVDLEIPPSASGIFALSTVSGTISTGLTQVRPVSQGAHAVRFNLGRGGADVTVRTFKGAIRVHPQ